MLMSLLIFTFVVIFLLAFFKPFNSSFNLLLLRELFCEGVRVALVLTTGQDDFESWQLTLLQRRYIPSKSLEFPQGNKRFQANFFGKDFVAEEIVLFGAVKDRFRHPPSEFYASFEVLEVTDRVQERF